VPRQCVYNDSECQAGVRRNQAGAISRSCSKEHEQREGERERERERWSFLWYYRNSLRCLARAKYALQTVTTHESHILIAYQKRGARVSYTDGRRRGMSGGWVMRRALSAVSVSRIRGLFPYPRSQVAASGCQAWICHGEWIVSLKTRY